MRKFFRCKSCLFPSTKPDLHFDDDGTCGACKYTKYYNNIDWEKRKNDFYELVDKFKSKNNQYGRCHTLVQSKPNLKTVLLY